MQIHRNPDSLPSIVNPVVTTGSFDGVHFGHSYIIKLLNENAGQLGGESVLITFHPHPRQVLYPDQAGRMMINSQEEKMVLLEQCGLQHVLVINFTRQFAALSSMDFIRQILVNKVGVRKVLIGYDHNFGRNQEGNFEFLYELGRYYNFDVEEIPAQDVQHVSVSSTKVRQVLRQGKMRQVHQWMGHPYLIVGELVQGAGLGKRLGIETFEVAFDDAAKIYPPPGVYAVKALCENVALPALAYIDEPTKNSRMRLHFQQAPTGFMGCRVQFWFYEKVRKPIQFNTLTDFKRQIVHDKVHLNDQRLKEKIMQQF